MNLKNLVIAAAILLLPVASALAAVPNLISYQGLLTDSSGSPLSNGPYLIQFQIYDAATAGNVLWANGYRQVQVTDGLFDYNLGDSVALPNQLFQNNSSLWLGVKVGTNPEMSPRTRLTSSGYALQALRSDSSGIAVSVYDNSITSGKIADGAVTSDKIADGTIASVDIDTSQVQQRVTGTAGAGQAIGAINSDGTVKEIAVGTGDITDVTAGTGLSGGGTTGSVTLGVNGAVVPLLSGSNTFTGTNQFNGNITGNLNLPASSATTGNILKGGALFMHNFGIENTFVGQNAGNLTMSGAGNTANGFGALFSNTTGSVNSAIGDNALYSNTTGFGNSAIGASALNSNTTGFGNTASGTNALYSNTTGGGNSAIGDLALYSNTTGSSNSAIGASALNSNTTGFGNTASGTNALINNNGDNNTASGNGALGTNGTGSNNTAIGAETGVSIGNLNNATAIGYGAVVNASNKIRLGNTLVTVIEGQVAYTFSSDKNQKENFRAVDGKEVLRKISEFELTSWNYKGNDPKAIRHYGPMAQDFFAAFGHDGVGAIGTETTINSGDMAGILIVAVQALGKENAELRARLESVEKEMKKLAGEKLAGK